METGEKIYKTMKTAGVASLVAGIIMIVVGTTVGIMGVVSGAMLLADKKKVMF